MKSFIAFINDSDFLKMLSVLLRIVIIVLILRFFKINIMNYSNFY